MTAPLRSMRAGWSSMCKTEDHLMCRNAQARCLCPCHGEDGQHAPSLAPVVNLHPNTRARVQLVRDEPPPMPSEVKVSFLDSVAALLPSVKDEPGVWFRVAVWPSKMSAPSRRTELARLHPDFEWVARRIGDGSGVWVRCP